MTTPNNRRTFSTWTRTALGQITWRKYCYRRK